MSQVLGPRLRRTTVIALFCGAILAGIGLSRIATFSGWLAIAACILGYVMYRRGSLVVIAAIAAGICLGGWRGDVTMQRLGLYNNYSSQKITIVGTAASDAVYGRQKQLSFDLSSIRVQNGPPLVGTVGVSGFGENMIFRGDSVEVTGKLRPGTGSHQAWVSYGELHVIRHDTSLLNGFRRNFSAGMLSSLPEPLGSFGMGLLVGGHSTLPDTAYEDLLMVGLVHIVAVSGYNLTIILRAAMKLFGKRSKYQMTLFSATLIGTFLLITGSSASIVRASIVSLLSLAAWYYGRAFKPLTLILLTAAGTALVNPLYVWGDMGWYLSFLAFYGVMILGPAVQERWVTPRLRESLVVGAALESLCAEVMTLPLVLMVFGQMSLVSLPANVLIATLVPLAMLTSLVAGLAGMLLLPIAGWLAWPASIILNYMLDAAHVLASIPHIFLEHIGFSLWAMVISYLAVLVASIVLHSRVKRNRAIITQEHETFALPYTEFLPAAQQPAYGTFRERKTPI